MRDNWIKFEGIIPIEACENMIQNFSKIEPIDATTYNNSKLRNSKVRWVKNEVGLIDHFLRYINLANAQAFNVDIQQEMDEMQFTEYDAEYEGKYDWHHDINWENDKNFDRKLSFVLQLSDPDTYKGGVFQFSEVETPKLEQGTILIFPSYLQHRVTKVIEGKRYSLVSWVRGPRWR